MMAFSLADGAAVAPVLSRLADPVEDPLTHGIIGERVVGRDVAYRFFDARDRANWAKVMAHFPNETVNLESWSDDRSRIIVHVTGRSDGDAYELVDLPSDTVVPVGPVSSAITSEDMSRVTQLTYASADGLQIDAYLTLPSGRDAHNLALIVMPHGGPAARDEPGFDWWAQALAARGYAVLQPQFRGSTGYGWDFMAAGFGQWGRKMQTDLSDGVRALIASGIADPKRVCIVGASYGGYAAVAGATLDPGVYRCAVAVGAVTDPASFIEWRNSRERRSESQQERYWSRYMGATGPEDPGLDAISPVKQASRANIPILLIHGKDDTVVPLSQSEDMAKALKKAGKSYDMVILDGEDHWLSRSKTRVEMLKVSTDFLLAQNPP
jgi:dipeptidyl aminopeptidase/acylaminoacyl peptidase